MPTLNLMDPRTPAGLAGRCPQCQHLVMWAHTYFGSRLPFDTETTPRSLDVDNAGWLPGMFLVAGKLRRVYAPLHQHPADKRQRARHVLLLHTCPELAAVA